MKRRGFVPGSWIGSLYTRGGWKIDKYGNKNFTPVTFRNIHTGNVYNSHGKLVGTEKTGQHHYFADPRKTKGRKQTARERAIMMKLRSRGKIR